MSRNALLIKCACAVVFSFLCIEQSESVERPGHTLFVTHFPEERQSLLCHRARCDTIPFHPGNDTQQIERECRALLVPQFPEQGQTLTAIGFGSIVVILSGG